jgi:hypothetical protein
MPLCDEEFIVLRIREMDHLLLAEEYAKARAIGEELIARYPQDTRPLKAAAYAAFLDEKSGDGSFRTIELFHEARRLQPDDLELWFWSAYTRVLNGDCVGFDEAETERLMEDLAFHDAQSTYVAYACTHHPQRYKDRDLGKKLVERGMSILPNLMALWDMRIGLAASEEEMRELFRQAKAMEPFHDYCEMRSMDDYVQWIIAQDAVFRRSQSLEHLLWSAGLGDPPPSPLPTLDDFLLGRDTGAPASDLDERDPTGDNPPR